MELQCPSARGLEPVAKTQPRAALALLGHGVGFMHRPPHVQLRDGLKHTRAETVACFVEGMTAFLHASSLMHRTILFLTIAAEAPRGA